MVRRRSSPPPRASLFDDNNKPTWLVAQNLWGKPLEVRALPAGTDLVRVFITELLRYHDDGWRLNEFSAFSASFYVTKLHEDKRRVCITVSDPSVPFEMRGLYGP